MDGFIYVSIAVTPFVVTQLSSNEGKEIIGSTGVWVAVTLLGAFNAGMVALKAFRSTKVADARVAAVKEKSV